MIVPPIYYKSKLFFLINRIKGWFSVSSNPNVTSKGYINVNDVIYSYVVCKCPCFGITTAFSCEGTILAFELDGNIDNFTIQEITKKFEKELD